MKTLFASLLLMAWTGVATAAEFAIRNDLLDRLANLTSVYGTPTAFEDYADALRRTGQADSTWNDIRVIRMSGPIVEGDAERLRDAIGRGNDATPFFIVFDSPGGNFLEGVRIGQVLEEMTRGNSDPTLRGALVLAGDECLSACAVALTLSITRDLVGYDRYVEQGGRLGFHMPFVPPEQQGTRTEIADAMNLTYEIMSEYVELIANGSAPAALLQNALHYREAEEFFLLQGGPVTRFMNFVPVVGPVGGTPITRDGLTVRDAFSMCQVLAFSDARDWSAGQYEFWSVELSREPPDGTLLDTLFQQIGGDRIQTVGCTIERRDDGTLGIRADGDCSGSATGWCVVPRGAFDPPPLPSATGALLADTLGCHGGRLTRGHYAWDWSNRFLEEEAPGDYQWAGSADPGQPRRVLDWTGARLKGDMTIPATSGDLPATVWRAGTPVTISDCMLAANGQGVFYETTNAGLTVWISARYVEVPALAALSAQPYLRTMIRPEGFD